MFQKKKNSIEVIVEEKDIIKESEDKTENDVETKSNAEDTATEEKDLEKYPGLEFEDKLKEILGWI